MFGQLSTFWTLQVQSQPARPSLPSGQSLLRNQRPAVTKQEKWWQFYKCQAKPWSSYTPQVQTALD